MTQIQRQVSYHSKTLIATQLVAPKRSRFKSLNLFISLRKQKTDPIQVDPDAPIDLQPVSQGNQGSVNST